MVAAAAFAAAFLFAPLCRNLAIHWGVLDRPDHNCRIHPGPIPRIGGLPIVEDKGPRVNRFTALSLVGIFAAVLSHAGVHGQLVRC
jgi:UDP-N-acetylmuramyl pentapeptide phosphotransferase/UDP-N-acetylglucosamine-1-phosphate transferase